MVQYNNIFKPINIYIQLTVSLYFGQFIFLINIKQYLIFKLINRDLVWLNSFNLCPNIIIFDLNTLLAQKWNKHNQQLVRVQAIYFIVS